MRWKLAAECRADGNALAAALGVAPPIGRLLAQRGVLEEDAALRFLNPDVTDLHDPFLLCDMDKAVSRLSSAMDAGEVIAVFGDYDVDGITSAALLGRVLGKLARKPGTIKTYVPHRHRDGYGLSPETIDHLHAEGAVVVVSADCGISGHAAAERATALGIDLIVTDHHEPQATLPDAYAIVNPKREGSRYPFRDLAGVGVAFKLAQALASRRGVTLEKFWPRFLDLVALGTVADNAPLLDENRAIVQLGLLRLSDTRKAGLRALLAAVGALQRPIRAATISFQVAPRLNAVGRVDDAALGLELMMTQDVTRAQELVAMLERLNDQRREEQERIWQEASDAIRAQGLAQDKVIVVHGANWHKGVVGIVAGRLADVYHRPALVVATDGDVARGSARSASSFPMIDALGACRDFLTDYGGHSQAAGFDMLVANLPGLRAGLNRFADGYLEEDDIIPSLDVDLEIEPYEITLAAFRDLARLEPFGAGNREPLWMARGFKVLSATCFGRADDRAHLSLRVCGEGMGPTDCVWWRKAARIDQFTPNSRCDMVFRMEQNHFGNGGLRLVIQDAVPGGTGGDSEFAGPAAETFSADGTTA
ncbi:MAG TPA: single-stranded-DNA-specific exonuclease RecJ [Armatimonadota bacterium]|jgi:single-stranded-DNA-specific exonuclease